MGSAWLGRVLSSLSGLAPMMRFYKLAQTCITIAQRGSKWINATKNGISLAGTSSIIIEQAGAD
eukprot:144346-Pyramimonas_sp.AAC.1